MGGELKNGDLSRIGPYRLIQVLGEGGMGRVYLGRSAGGRLVAVKVIRRELTVDPGFRERFKREVAAAQRVNGLYTAHVVDADTDGPQPWLATAYIDAPSLAARVHDLGPLPAREVRPFAAALAEGLREIHAAGLVHRDLTPRNVLLASDGPRIIDFGLARMTESPSLTQSGTLVGTPGYMSPEQVRGGEVGQSSDVFSLGTVIHYAATGDGPWGTGATEAMLYRLVHEPPNVDRVPASVRPVVLRCLAKEPDSRPTPAEILAELGDPDLLGDGRPVQPLATWDGTLLAPDLSAGMPDPASEPNTMSMPGNPQQQPPLRPKTAPPASGTGRKDAAPGQRPAPARPRSAEDILRTGIVLLMVAAITAGAVIVWLINEWFAITVYALTAVFVAVWWLRS